MGCEANLISNSNAFISSLYHKRVNGNDQGILSIFHTTKWQRICKSFFCHYYYAIFVLISFQEELHVSALKETKSSKSVPTDF
jgi:hypothetical protein